MSDRNSPTPKSRESGYLDLEPRQPEMHFIGMGLCKHDMICGVCRNHKAVFTMPEAVFLPCWQCQERGWFIGHTRSKWFHWLLEKLGFVVGSGMRRHNV